MTAGTRLDLTAWEFVRVETRGASEKVWLQEPDGTSTRPQTHWLFKPVTVHDDGSRQLGDWTEAAASKIAAALDLPAATAVLASRAGIEGVATQNVRPAGYDMVTGRMAMIDEIGVETRDSNRDKTASVGHTLQNVQRALDGYGPPPAVDSWADCEGFDVLAGYLLLDALIANGDRHEQNWSVLRATTRSASRSDAVAAAYDMEASMGFQLTDAARSARLGDRRGMDAFVRKGYARRFHGDLRTSLVDFAARAYGLASEPGRARLDTVVDAIADCEFQQILETVGGVSDVARTFAVELLQLNGRRIQDAIDVG